MARIFCWLLVACCTILACALAHTRPACAQPALPATRVALVIGNSAYRYVSPLTNPGNDARLVALTLQRLGFTLVGDDAQLDLDKPQFDQAVRLFGQAIRGADVALLYYSGHGMQIDDTNWLVPVDANLGDQQDLDFQMVSAELILHQLTLAGARLKIVILDACRSNPFRSTRLRGVERGLAQMQAPEGTLISYATQPGNVALDGTGQNSPYTAALAEAMAQPGLDIFRTFNRVGVSVMRTTNGRQQPWVSNSPIDGDFYFAGIAPTVATPPPSPPAPVSPTPPAQPPQNAQASVAAARPSPMPDDPTTNFAGTWRYPDGVACSSTHVGLVAVVDGHIRFEWRYGRGRPNIAVERVDAVEGNVIFTTVERDENTPTPETGQRIRYVVTHDSWTSENLATGAVATHRRC